MDVDSLLKITGENLSEYFSVVVRTLTKPLVQFQPLRPQPNDDDLSRLRITQGARLNPKLFGFAAASVVTGFTLTSLIPNTLITEGAAEPPTLAAAVIGSIVFWTVYASFAHLLCRLLHGDGDILDTVSVCLQLFAVLYLVAAVFALASSVAAQIRIVAHWLGLLGPLGRLLVRHPTDFYSAFHAILMFVYFPIALGAVHRFGWRRRIAIGLLSVPIIVLLSHSLIRGTGVYHLPEPPWNLR